MSGWRIPLRLAWRDALRHKGRSVLVVAMVGLPVLGLTTADVLVRTAQLSPAERAERQLGTADALVYSGGSALSARTLVSRLGAGTTVATLAGGAVVDRRPAGLAQVAVTQVDLTSPIVRGMFRLRSGRAPAAADEVLVTTALAGHAHLRVGGMWTLSDPARTVRVVGTFVVPDQLSADQVIVRPGDLLPPTGSTSPTSYTAQPAADPTFLVRTSVPQDRIAARLGGDVSVTTRNDVLHPLPTSPSLVTQRTVVAVVAIGLGVLQVVLLAGAAFAVGARRQVRDLALVAAAGGERRHVRNVVLGGGVIAGLVGGVGGVALGVPLAVVLLPYAERYSGTLAGSFDLRPAEIALGTLIGLVAGVLAATLPARTAARQDVVQALSGRRGIRGTSARLTVGGLAAIVVGAVVTVKGAAPPAHATWVLAGSVVAELGFIATAPALIGLAARGARVLPVSGRMALRDAARHRARSGPAVAAVMAALAGAIAISTYLVSSNGYDRIQYQGQARLGQAVVYTNGDGTSVPQVTVDAIAAALPTRAVAALGRAYVPCTESAQDTANRIPIEDACPSLQLDGLTSTEPARSDGGAASAAASAQVAFGGPDLLRALLGRDDPVAVAALQAGSAVVIQPRTTGSSVTLSTYADGGGTERPLATLRAVVVPLGEKNLPYDFPGAVVSTVVAQRFGIATAPQYVVFDTTRTPTDAEQQRANAILATSRAGSLEVERGFSSSGGIVQLALAGVAAIVTIAAVAIATGLAAAEGRADLATLAAVGASPGLRRRLAMAQAGVVALLGAGLGVLSGLVPAVAVVHARAGWPLLLPWTVILVSVVGVPLLAAGLAGVVTRSRLPLAARAT